MNNKKIISLDELSRYDENIKGYVDGQISTNIPILDARKGTINFNDYFVENTAYIVIGKCSMFSPSYTGDSAQADCYLWALVTKKSWTGDTIYQSLKPLNLAIGNSGGIQVSKPIILYRTSPSMQWSSVALMTTAYRSNISQYVGFSANGAYSMYNDLNGKITKNTNSIAPTYSSSSTYALGSYVMYNSTLYKCTTAIDTAESWNDNHWDSVKITEELGGSTLKDLKVYYVENNSSSNPLILSEVPTGIYYIKPSEFTGSLFTSYPVYFKGNSNGSSISVYAVPDQPFIYFKHVNDVSSGTSKVMYKSFYSLDNRVENFVNWYSYNASTGALTTNQISHSNAKIVNLDYAQTISGKKTFSTLPESSVVPTTDNQLVNKSYVDGQDAALVANIAPAYSSSSTYALGSYVTYNKVLYKCTTEISTAEAWTVAHWTQTTVMQELENINTALAALTTPSSGE